MRRTTGTRLRAITTVLALVAALLVPALAVATPTVSASATTNGALFNAGNIISNATMYDSGSMSADDIQSFLSQKEAPCSGSCLENYSQATPSMPAGRCAAYTGSPSERAADIISRVGIACGLSPKVLLVTMEKEQSLVSSRNASAGSFNFAMGYNCPDTAACDPTYGTFFYQVYYAARQFQIYAQTATQWNYQAGRNNQIAYSPNGNCGSSTVFIQNQATAALYIYTPYQPDAAALANLYGTGDGCSSYGNRNFWRIFSDWFGSPTAASSLLRTADNATVYLVSDTFKYPIPSISILTALAPLGQVGYVSQSLLDTFTTGHLVGRSIRGPDGSIYFYDSGIKLPFNSCAQAADYGASCDASGYVQLSQAQVDAFATGPVLSNVMGTVEGARYYVKNGTKAEILDDQSQAAAGIPPGMNVLTENALSAIPLVAPIIRDGVYAATRGASTYSLLSGGSQYPLSTDTATAVGAPPRAVGSLWSSSLALIPTAATAFTGIVSGPAGGATVLTATGSLTLQAGGLKSSYTPVPVAQPIIDAYPSLGSIAAGSFIKSPTNGTVYIVMATDIRPVSSWDALLALTTNNNPVIITVPQSVVDMLTTGPVALTAGTLVRSPDNATVYFINGVTSRIALSVFDYPVDAGFGTLVFSTDDRIDGYPLATQNMTFGMSCGTDDYIAGGQQVHLVPPSLLALYPFTYVPMDQFTCGQMKRGAAATSFIRTPDGSIYELANQQKLPIANMTRYAQISAGAGWTNVSDRFAAQYTTGPLA